jgi:plasmid stabilization system protein ParE
LVVTRIIASVDRLQAFPDSGRIVPERGDPEIREVIVRPYRVVYRRRANEVEIATVFRASRLLPDIG